MDLTQLSGKIGSFFSNLGTQVHTTIAPAQQNVGQGFSNVGSNVQSAVQNVSQNRPQINIPQVQMPNFNDLAGSFKNTISSLGSKQFLPGMTPGEQASPQDYANNFSKYIAPALQSIPRTGFEGAMTLSGDKNTYNPQQFDPINHAILGSAPLQNFNDPKRPAGQFLKNLGVPQGVVQVGTPAMAVAGAIASDIPGFGSVGKKVGTQEAIQLAKNAGTVEDFVKGLAQASPQAKTAVANIIKDSKTPVNSVEDFFNVAKGGSGSVPKNLNIPAAQISEQTGKSGKSASQLPLQNPQEGQIPEQLSQANTRNPSSSSIPQDVNMTATEGKNLAANLGLKGTTPTIPTGEKPLGVVDTIKNSDKTSAQLKDTLQGAYNVAGNKETLSAAENRIATYPNNAYNFAVNNHNAEANATAVLLAKQYEAAGQAGMAANLMVQKAKQALEAGQGNQIYSVWDKLSPETVGQTAAKLIENARSQGAKIPSLTQQQYQGFVDQAKVIQGITDARQKGIATQKLLNAIGSLIPSSGLSKTVAIWRTGLLTGARTVGKVLVSHAAFGASGLEGLSKLPANALDKGASFVTGNRSMSLTARGVVQGTKNGILAGVDNLVHGYNAPNSGGFAKDFSNQVNFGNSLFGKAAQAYVDTIGRLHGSLYKPFFGATHLNSLYDQALTAAGNKGLSGLDKENFVKDFVASPPAQAAAQALKEAEYATFQNKTTLGTIASGVAKAGGGMGRFVVPFTQIPSSIAMKVVDYSPVGAVRSIIDGIKAARSDTGLAINAQRQLVQGLGRSITGTGVYAIGSALAAKGLLSGSYPTDKNEQALWKAQGKTADSLLVGGKWRTLSSLGPLGDAISIGGHLYNGLQQGGIMSGIGEAGAGGASVLANAPYVQELNSISQALNDPVNKSTGLIKSLAGSIVPTAIGNIATATDPYQRQTNNPVVDSITNKIPGLREQNLPQQDFFGQAIPRATSAIGSLLDPFYSSTNRQTPITNELQRLQDSGNAVSLTPLTKNQTVYGQKVKLTPDQINQGMSTLGPQVQQQIQGLMSSPAYQQLDDKQKAQVLSNAASGIKNNDMILNQVINGGSSGGVVPMVNSSGLQTGSVSQTPTMDKYQLQAAKDAFANGADNFKDLGSIVLRKDAAGNVSAMTKDAFNTSLYEGQMMQDKNSKDLNSYVQHGNSLVQLYQKQLDDPNVDQLDKIQIGNKLTALQNTLDKYQGYGGFAKGKAARKMATIKSAPLGKVAPFKLSTGKLKIGKSPSLRIVAGSNAKVSTKTPNTKAVAKQFAKFKETSPRVYLSMSGSSQRGIRKAAGISVPTRQRKQPHLTI